MDGADDLLAPTVVAENAAGHLDAGGQGGFAHEPVSPDGVEKLVFGHESISVRYQVADHLEDLGLDRHGFTRVGELLALETFMLLGTCLVCALTLKTLSKELDLLGATAGALICLILPAAFYLKALSVHENDGTLEQHFGRRGSCRLACKRATAWLMLIAGSLLGISSFSLTLYYWDSFS